MSHEGKTRGYIKRNVKDCQGGHQEERKEKEHIRRSAKQRDEGVPSSSEVRAGWKKGESFLGTTN